MKAAIAENKKKEHCRLLSRRQVEYLDFVERNPATLSRANYRQMKGFKDKIVLQPWPAFVNREIRQKLQDAGGKGMQLIKSIPGKLFSHDPVKISRYYGIPELYVRSFLKGATPQNINSLVGRGDMILTPGGEFKCIEFNIAANLGGVELSHMQTQYLQHPLTAQFMRENSVKILNKNLMAILFEHVIDNLLENRVPRPQKGEELNVAIAWSNYDPWKTGYTDPFNLNPIYQKVLKSKGAGFEGSLITSCVTLLDSRKDGLFSNDKKISAILAYGVKAMSEELLNLFYNGHLLLFNGPITPLMANKLNLALLSENEDSHLFTPEERHSIKEIFPWTRRTETGETTFHGDTVQLESFVLQNRDKLVLKPAQGIGGEGLSNGKFCTDRQWSEAVLRAFKEKHWVVQENVPSASFLFQSKAHGCEDYYPIWGTFDFGGRYGGSWLRILPVAKYNGGISSTHFGAEETVLLEVEE